jgi:glycosyltransferase involved in cell wall biosynthesis
MSVDTPLISFCIATYKRPQLLGLTIKAILKQDYQNLEIIVSDNDSQGSARAVTENFKSKKITYHKNKTNIGMMNNFNMAFRHSHGDYIVFMADDDPPESAMLTLLMKLKKKYPNAGAYFGASSFIVKDSIIPKVHRGLKIGKNSQANKNLPKGYTEIVSPSAFLPKFLRFEIFNYFLWSCGMVKRDVINKIGKLKTVNGSNYFTDFAFILNVGTSTQMAIVNKELGSQSIHLENNGRTNKNLLTLPNATKGFYDQFVSQARELGCEADLEKFLRNWVREHLLSVFRFRRFTNQKEDQNLIARIYRDIAHEYHFFRKDYLYFYSRLFFPTTMEKFDKYKWILEMRNFKLLGKKLLNLARAT